MMLNQSTLEHLKTVPSIKRPAYPRKELQSILSTDILIDLQSRIVPNTLETQCIRCKVKVCISAGSM